MQTATTFFLIDAGVLSLALLLPRPAAAGWPTDPLVNVPVCTASGVAFLPMIVSDGAGGVIISWEDGRGSVPYAIYAQRVLASGAVDTAWPVNGRVLNTYSSAYPKTCAAGNGGSIVTWQDYRNGTGYGRPNVYAQHVLASGVLDPVWPASGRALSTDVGGQFAPAPVTDGGGGAIVAWSDTRSGNGDIYVAHLLGSGVVDPAWPFNGLALCNAIDDQQLPTVVPASAGGAIVTWEDHRGGTPAIYAQRVLATGVVDPAWPATGRAISPAGISTHGGSYPTIVSDGASGAIVVWSGPPDTTLSEDIYAQHVLASGALDPLWPAGGRALSAAGGGQYGPSIASDGAGGAIVAWSDGRSGAAGIYAQRILGSGVVDPNWPADGRALSIWAGLQNSATIVSDGAGGGIAAWTRRNALSFDTDIYAQRVLASGVIAPGWPVDGRALCNAPGGQAYLSIIRADAGGAIVAWQDERNSSGGSGVTTDIYAQLVQANGQLGGEVTDVSGEPPLALALEPLRPNPTRGNALTIHFSLASSAAASLNVLDVAGRRIAGREVGSLGAGRHILDVGEGQHLAPGLYLVCLRQGLNTRVTRVAVLE